MLLSKKKKTAAAASRPDVVVVIDWPDAIANHGLAVANAAMVLASMRWRRRRRRRRRSVDDDDVQTIVLPSYTRRRYTLPRIFGELVMDDDERGEMCVCTHISLCMHTHISH
jgi:hypothetical protein